MNDLPSWFDRFIDSTPLVVMTIVALCPFVGAIVLYVRSWRWKHRWVHIPAHIAGRYESPRDTLILAFRPLGKDNESPLQTIELETGRWNRPRESISGEVEIMYPLGRPAQAQLTRSYYLWAHLCMLVFLIEMLAIFVFVARAIALGNLLMK